MSDLRNEHYRKDNDGKRTIPKKSYPSQTTAINFLKNHGEDLHDWSVYKCLICGKWHIGHNRNISFEELYKKSKEDVKFLKDLLFERDKEIERLKEELEHVTTRVS